MATTKKGKNLHFWGGGSTGGGEGTSFGGCRERARSHMQMVSVCLCDTQMNSVVQESAESLTCE